MVLQLLILWDGNDYYRIFILPFAISILFKTLQVLIVSVPPSILVFIFILFFVGRHTMRSWVLRNILKFVGNESHENIPAGLCTILECIHNL
jgi:hypothetical protein